MSIDKLTKGLKQVLQLSQSLNISQQMELLIVVSGDYSNWINRSRKISHERKTEMNITFIKQGQATNIQSIILLIKLLNTYNKINIGHVKGF